MRYLSATSIPTPDPTASNVLATFRLSVDGDHAKLVTVTSEVLNFQDRRFVVRRDGMLATRYEMDKGVTYGEFTAAADAMKFALDMCGWS